MPLSRPGFAGRSRSARGSVNPAGIIRGSGGVRVASSSASINIRKRSVAVKGVGKSINRGNGRGK